MLEHGAGVYLLAGTFLFRNTALRGIYEELSGTLKSYHREETERNKKLTVAMIIVTAESSVKAGGNAVRKLIGIAAADSALLVCSDSAQAECYRVGNLTDCKRHAVALALAERLRAETVVITGTEYADVALAAVKYNLFLGNRKSLELGYLTGADACLHCKLNIETNVYREKSAVEFHRLYCKTGPDNLRTLYSQISCLFYNFLTVLAQKDFYVLKAVLVTAAVKNTVYRQRNALARHISEKTIFIIRHFLSKSFLPDYLNLSGTYGAAHGRPHTAYLTPDVKINKDFRNGKDVKEIFISASITGYAASADLVNTNKQTKGIIKT